MFETRCFRFQGTIAEGDPNAHSYMQSSVYVQNNADGGEPKVYQAHHSKRTAPGGVSH